MRKNSVNHEDIKKSNQATVLKLIMEKKSISKRELQRLTGLTYATVSNLVGELIECGLIIEAGFDTSSKRLGGPNPLLLAISNGPPYVVAIHIGVTVGSVGVINLQGKIGATKNYKIDADMTVEKLIAAIQKSVAAILKQLKISLSADILGVGVAVGGIVNAETGAIQWHENPVFRNAPIGDLISQAMSKPVFVSNVVEALALGEAKYGKQKVLNNFSYLFVGGFVGCAIVVDGKVVHGKRHSAGQIGHTIIEEQGPVCKCGRRGCMQAILSRSAVNSHIQTLLEQGKAPLLKNIANPFQEITKEDIMRLARNGDEDCRKLLEYLGFHLGKSVANIVNLVDPEVVIVALAMDFQQNTSEEVILGEDNYHGAIQGLSEIEEKSILKAYAERVNNPEKAPHIRFTYIRQSMVLVGAVAVAIDNLFLNRVDLMRVAKNNFSI